MNLDEVKKEKKNKRKSGEKAYAEVAVTAPAAAASVICGRVRQGPSD